MNKGKKQRGEFLSQVRPHLEALLCAETECGAFIEIPKEDRRYLNVLMSFREEFWRDFRNGLFDPALTLAADFDLPWSSQAFCFNLFYPFIQESYDRLALFQVLAGVPVGGILSASFGCCCGPGSTMRYDFAIEHEDGSRIFFVVRYAEEQFGDGSAESAMQLFHGLRADDRHRIGFILPAANTALNADLDRLLAAGDVPSARVARIAIDQVLEQLARTHEGDAAGRDVRDVTHEDLMLDKYFPYLREQEAHNA